LLDRRNIVENSCNSGDGTDQTGLILDVYNDDEFITLRCVIPVVRVTRWELCCVVLTILLPPNDDEFIFKKKKKKKERKKERKKYVAFAMCDIPLCV